MFDREKAIHTQRTKLARQEAALKDTMDEIQNLEKILATVPGADKSSIVHTIGNLRTKRDRQHNTVQSTARYLELLELHQATVPPESPQRKTSARGSQT